MLPHVLDRLIHGKKSKHGERTCPKCERGYMAYMPSGSSSFYSCQECSWIEFNHPKWVPMKERA